MSYHSSMMPTKTIILLMATLLLTACGPGQKEMQRDIEQLQVENEALRRDLERFQDELMRLSGAVEYSLRENPDPQAVDVGDAEPEEETATGPAVLELRSEPPSEVFKNSVRIGTTPFTTEVDPGSFILEFRCTTCTPEQREAVGVEVGPGEEYFRMVRFKPI